MAAIQTLPELLETLTSSLNTISSTLPSSESIKPPADGISLLDTKNELLLAYLQNLVFLILLKLRNTKPQITSPKNDTTNNPNATNNQETPTTQRFHADEIVQRLIELRLYLERGVKPLENKLRYQIDRAVRAADDYEARRTQQQQKHPETKSNSKLRAAKTKTKTKRSDASSDDSASDVESVASTASSVLSGSDGLGAISRPNLASFARPSAPTSSSKKPSSGSVYKPPRIAPTALPSASPTSKPHRQRKSHILDDYISHELSAAPIAEPSIGTNIIDRGRRDVLSVRERTVAADRQRYEEENLVRLPGVSKKEKQMLRGDRMRRGQFGGEEWSGLGGSAERIVDLVRKKGGKGALERSRKREREDGGGSGEVGVAFEKKRKMLERRRK